MSNNIMIKRLEKRLGLDLRVSRSRSWSRSIIEGLGLVSVSENFERSRSRSWSRKKNKCLGLVSVSEPKVSFTSLENKNRFEICRIEFALNSANK